MTNLLINKNNKSYFSSFFLYNTARVLPHAVLTVILLDKGMTIGEIAIIQSFFMVAGLLFELPSGLLTDSWSEKRMYQLSLVLLAISYLIIMMSYNFYILCFSWFIYGISNAAISGSLEAYFVRRLTNDERKIKAFNIKYNNVNIYSTLLGGGVGSVIYSYFSDNLYVVSLVMIAVSFLIISLGFKDSKTEFSERPTLKDSLKDMKNLKNNNQLMIFIFSLALFQIILQLFFQFWQVMFLDKNFGKEYFGIIYILFQLMAILSNYIFERVNLKNKHLILIVSLSGLLILAICLTNKWLFVATIILFLIPFNLYNNQLIVDIQQQASVKNVSAIMSLAGTIGSVVAMLFLWSMGFLNKFYSFNVITIIIILFFMLLSLLLIASKRWRNV
ncbi:MFS transporter [Dellaglioa algida]|uniref:MFS transporter n=1 Tax=Dellaglioa algida TaxID=105612 RepID=UPI0024C4C385|nr:MFS transporter [Dellaglioa algida]MDK1728438.1 MFS transporter [Dellaglioa algida]MDK1736158.1 MFS transporter [Dellaglioa algida]MDK1737803.1 MFS transporter [Dellaglioa algida]